ncbi:PepSY-associated TM helix domain-containing protein [Saccharicrinis fermentans]|uniref:Putative iron-regulated membrane protein n=1 Tax=Saccharicrinis fermentans DSM 9555 = JCM 21142 TaxID=869213 RepID=W7YBH6_9BACT|nr:PepSY-associated TM helix domain-containing protein [Saccharicrinis fermentans]GAF01776.1 putative iron-regulated membrane protein [Saccharicrinis fermentans DSM 9555 = JCM 21142]
MRHIHLYLGIISGIIVFIISITGALYAFKEEIESLNADYKKVQAENKNRILPSKAISIGKKLNPGIQIHAAIYREKDDALEIVYYQAEPMHYSAVYINPYSGEYIKSIDYLKSFWGLVLHGHMALWLPLNIGMPIVAIGTLIFLILLITGLILWWPRNFRIKGVFSFSRNKTKHIKTASIHKVVGFYILIPALIIALTGASWLFGSLAKLIYTSFGGQMEVKYTMLPSDITQKEKYNYPTQAIDMVYQKVKNENKNIPFLEIHPPQKDNESILVELNREPSTHWKMDYIFYDQYTLQELKPKHIYGRYEMAGLPEKIRRMNYDIHTGNILGIPGKICAFLISLFCASLPITGMIMWISRRKQKKKFIQEFDI